MSADRLLASLLRSFQNFHSPPETSRLTSTSASLLTTLANPLNTTLLTSQILTATAFWDHPDGLRVCLRILGIFQSASLAILQGAEAPPPGQPPLQQIKQLDRTEWVKAVVKGADERTPRWKHLLVIAGVLLGFEGQERRGLSKGVRQDLEGALVLAANLAMEEVGRREDGLDGFCIAMVLNYAFELLSDWRRRDLHYNKLLPLLVDVVFFSPEGYQSGYFLAPIDADIVATKDNQFTWSDKSPTFFLLQRLSTRPLVSSMGPLSLLLAHCTTCAPPQQLHDLLTSLLQFSKTLTTQWRQNKLSETDPSEEPLYLDPQALKFTIPILWQVLKTAMFATVVVLRAVMGRVLLDHQLAADESAPVIAAKVLHTLRNLYFVTSRLGPNAFSTYTFVLLSAIDVLTTYPPHATTFIREIQPHLLSQIPPHPLDRCLDLYFLNTAEHFASILPQQVNEEVLIAAVSPYLQGGHHRSLLDMFEAAHSVFLAVVSALGNAELAGRVIPFYVDAVFKTFPSNLSPRQFRLAFKILLQITTPPSPLSLTHPTLPSILLELLYHRALHAPYTPLPLSQSPPDSPPTTTTEQATLTLALIDILPSLPLSTLEEWIDIIADLVGKVEGEAEREEVKGRFWEVLWGGEMDVERAEFCVVWWGTRGGRGRILGEEAAGAGAEGERSLM
ncbi:hypothetical protein FGG08_006288 [Glutinoglossum americanum]|uniref:Peroxisomal membrane protein PEX17 n=1 Tax=Glutinoglossum americanum TaxID=1670608 RepID=A0A9P8KV47_9PEZI|nr:hypothetical protein FGG08_006288 [Glutinoglossum americanum]